MTGATLIFIYGKAASGKLTVARELAARTGFGLFHNHLVVDTLLAVFPFGSPSFVRLRDRFWMDVFEAAARDGRSLIFTFAPEASVPVDFPARASAAMDEAGGRTFFVALDLSDALQEERIANEDRAVFRKLRSLDVLRQLRQQQGDVPMGAEAMPEPDLRIDTGTTSPQDAAEQIARLLGERA